MKRNVLFVVGLVALLLLFYHLGKDAPPPFSWEKTYETTDPNPYGGEALDKVLAASWKERGGFLHSYDRVEDILDNDTLPEANLLIVCDHLEIPEWEIDQLFEYIRAGANVLLVSASINYQLQDELGVTPYIREERIRESLDRLQIEVFRQEAPVTSLAFHPARGDSLTNVPLVFVPYYFEFKDKSYLSEGAIHTLATNSSDQPVMLRYEMGLGELYLSCTPALFTNYAVLNDSTRPYLDQSLAYLADRPLIRTEYYQVGSQGEAETQETEFRVLLQNPSTRWGYYLLLISIALFMIFTAKRKQRPIPVVDPPANRILDFIASITNLYLTRNNNVDIVRKRYGFWAEEMRGKYGVDVVNEKHNQSFYQRFAAKTGRDEQEMQKLFEALDALKNYPTLTDKEMMELINKLNTF